jgi:hypothetical protein
MQTPTGQSAQPPQQMSGFQAKNQQQVTTLNKEDFEKRQRQIGNIENNLL